jgi:uncharacterized protein (DUF58 family)
VTGLLGHLAVRHGDLVGCAYGDGDTQTVLPARGGATHVERCLQAVGDAIAPGAARSDLAALLREVARSVRRRCLVVVVADVVEPEPEVLSAVRRLRVQHEVLVVLVRGMDPLDPGRGDGRDDGRDRLDVDTALPVPGWLRRDRRLAEQLTTVVEADRASLTEALDRMAVAHVHVPDLPSVVPAVRRLLERHRRAGR